jgi:REP element-mobilizing transposase RayT
MTEPLAYFITWSTYGSWLPGDARGWVHGPTGAGQPIQPPDPQREAEARRRLKQSPVALTREQRGIVDTTIHSVCQYRGWALHAVNCRTNHIHVVLSAPAAMPEHVMNQLKAWCSRHLNQSNPSLPHPTWWTRHGSTRYLNTEESVADAVDYVLNRQ